MTRVNSRARREHVRVGTAGWSLDRALAPGTRHGASGLERYAEYFDTVEINSTFYRLPRIVTLERWRDSTPATFRFCVKMPQSITHEAGLIGTRRELASFCALVSHLGPKLGPLLVQLPPSLALDRRAAARFFRDLRAAAPAPVVLEPRHPSWFTSRAEELLLQQEISRVAADPARCSGAAEPGGAPRVSYFRWHGSPQMYFSSYETPLLRSLAQQAGHCHSAGSDVYCIFDNTALGAAAINAMTLGTELQRSLASPRIPQRSAGSRTAARQDGSASRPRRTS